MKSNDWFLFSFPEPSTSLLPPWTAEIGGRFCPLPDSVLFLPLSFFSSKSKIALVEPAVRSFLFFLTHLFRPAGTPSDDVVQDDFLSPGFPRVNSFSPFLIVIFFFRRVNGRVAVFFSPYKPPQGAFPSNKNTTISPPFFLRRLSPFSSFFGTVAPSYRRRWECLPSFLRRTLPSGHSLSESVCGSYLFLKRYSLGRRTPLLVVPLYFPSFCERDTSSFRPAPGCCARQDRVPLSRQRPLIHLFNFPPVRWRALEFFFATFYLPLFPFLWRTVPPNWTNKWRLPFTF